MGGVARYGQGVGSVVCCVYLRDRQQGMCGGGHTRAVQTHNCGQCRDGKGNVPTTEERWPKKRAGAACVKPKQGSIAC